MTAEQIRLLDDLRMHLGMLAYGRHMLAEIDLDHLDLAETLALELWRSIPADDRLAICSMERAA